MGKFAESVAAFFKPDVDEDITKKGVVWNALGEMQSCVFCDLVQNDKENRLLFQDELVAAFTSLKPAAKQHILVIPKKHISTVGDLTLDDAQVLARMREVAERLLKCDPSNAQYSFHMPPWNSIGEILGRGREIERERQLSCLRVSATAACTCLCHELSPQETARLSGGPVLNASRKCAHSSETNHHHWHRALPVGGN